jgi:predicted DNA-binding transcriptional regulator AlpA
MGTTTLKLVKEVRLSQQNAIREPLQLITVRRVAELLAVSESHVYMLERTGCIESVDITCNGNGGPKSKRYTKRSVLAFQLKRLTVEEQPLKTQTKKGSK